MEWNGKYKIGNNDFVTLLRIKKQSKKIHTFLHLFYYLCYYCFLFALFIFTSENFDRENGFKNIKNNKKSNDT